MEIRPDLAPPADARGPLAPAAPGAAPADAATAARTSESGPSRFKQALAEVEKHRTKVQAALAAALVARLLFEFQFVSLLRDSRNLVVQVPYIGLAMLSYLLVLMWLAARTRDRFGFGMALGIGVLEATYLVVAALMTRPFSLGAVWPPLVVALAHIPMAFFAFKSASAYPPLDSKRPWLVGFITALVFLSIPWFAPALMDAMK
jgi:hypothetical protein